MRIVLGRNIYVFRRYCCYVVAVPGKARFSVQLPPNYRRQLITRVNFERFSAADASESISLLLASTRADIPFFLSLSRSHILNFAAPRVSFYKRLSLARSIPKV